MLCLWQGPLPVWHAHGTLATTPGVSQSWLADHLQTHHASVDPCEPSFFGWHLHFEVPDADGPPEDAPSPGLRCPVVHANGSDIVQPLVRDMLHVMPATVRTLHLAKPMGRQRFFCFARRGFFPDDAASLPLPLRLGVSRC